VSGSGFGARHWTGLRNAGFDITDVTTFVPDALDNAIRGAEAYLLGGDERLTRERLDAATDLKVISFVGTGYGMFIDSDAAVARGIAVLNTPGVMAQAVAEHTVGLLIGVIRDLFAQNEMVKRGGGQSATTVELADCTIGIVGLGASGTAVARMLRGGFGCRVVYYSRTRKLDVEQELGIRFVELGELVATVDAVILLLPTSSDTEGIWSATMFEAAKPGQVLVNTGGPRLVEPNAMREALVAGHLKAAAFDGYWVEPIPPEDSDPFGLISLPDRKFVVTPHTAAKTTRTWERMLDRAVANLMAFDGFR